MKVNFQTAFFSPDLQLLEAGIREVPDTWDLPKDAERVEDDVPETPSGEEYQPTEPVSMADLARPTAQEGKDLRTQNSTLKGQLTKTQNQLKKLAAAMKAAGIEVED